MVNVNKKFVQGGYGIVLEGADEALKAIKALAPDLDKELKGKLRDVGNRIIKDARANVPGRSPLSRWERIPKDPVGWAAARGVSTRAGGGGFPTFDSGKIKAGIKGGTGKPKGAKFGALVYVTNTDAAGSIFEVVGRRNRPTSPQGAHFIRVLEDYREASRVIWDAYDSMGRKAVEQEIIDAVEEAEAELQRRFGEGGFTETSR